MRGMASRPDDRGPRDLLDDEGRDEPRDAGRPPRSPAGECACPNEAESDEYELFMYK